MHKSYLKIEKEAIKNPGACLRLKDNRTRKKGAHRKTYRARSTAVLVSMEQTLPHQRISTALGKKYMLYLALDKYSQAISIEFGFFVVVYFYIFL